MQWWYEARFGMFIHFGSYSYLGHGEWAFFTEGWNKRDYQQQVSAKFNPSNFDAGVIARLAKTAGMKYLVITAKHHEGFSMWPTTVPSFKDFTGTKEYSLPDFTNFGKRDILKELKDSCEANGIKFCLYYSILDWCHSSQNINRSTYYSDMVSDSARISYIKDMKSQLNELINRYHPAIMWLDGDWTKNSGKPTLSSWWTKDDGEDLYKYLVSLDSNLIINERVARSFGLGDYECPEQEVPALPRNRPWETCQTMNGSWGFNASDTNYKTSSTLIHELVKVVSRDGNYLLNIGPKGDGTVPPQSVSILDSIGEWFAAYGESIHGTSRSPFKSESKWGFFTKKLGKLYVHIFNLPDDEFLKIPSLKNIVSKIYLMNDPSKALNYTSNDKDIVISLPENVPNLINSVVVVEVVGTPTALGE
jgi:alpha-L-fucosidase